LGSKRKTDHLWQRGDQYWLRLKIPRSLQLLFPLRSKSGKPFDHIATPLGDSKSVALIESNRLVSLYLGIFERLRAGEVLTQEQVNSIIRTDPKELARIRQATHQHYLSMFDTEKRSFADATEQAKWEGYLAAQQDYLKKHSALTPATSEETITQALEKWITERQRDDEPPRRDTVDGHRGRVKAFTDRFGDLPLTSITKAIASDFMASLDGANRTRNNYVATMTYAFEHAKNHGRFDGQNPFNGLRRKAGDEERPKFSDEELQKILDALPRAVKFTKHSADTALPWITLIALYSGMRLEEACQLSVGDLREEGTNGSRVLVFDIHNGGSNLLKNKASARLVPVHKQLIKAGLLDYAKALPKDGKLFPGLRRGGKGKLGEHISSRFRKLIVRLGIKADERKGLCFHSLRHNFGRCLDIADESQRNAARLMGHAVEGITFGVYGEGELLNLASIVQKAVKYPGLAL
jgi:integrase